MKRLTIWIVIGIIAYLAGSAARHYYNQRVEDYAVIVKQQGR